MLKYYFNGSPNPLKVTLFLEESGLAYQPAPIDAFRGDQFKPGYLAINPNGKSPPSMKFRPGRRPFAPWH